MTIDRKLTYSNPHKHITSAAIYKSIARDKAWTVEQTAVYLDMCLKTVYKYIKKGKLPATNVDRQYYISSYDAREIKP